MGAESQNPAGLNGQPPGASAGPGEQPQGEWPSQLPDADAPLAPLPPSQADTTAILPQRLRPRPPRQLSPWATLGLLTLATIVVVSAGLYAYARAASGGGGGTTVPPGCDQQGSPCQVAQAYLAAYTAGKYEAMYALVSDASKTRFSDKQILGDTYSDAHDYIVNRTSGLLAEAEVYAVQATSGGQRVTGKATAVVPAHIVMQTQRIGTITQDIQIPLVHEATSGQWRVNWSPGLVFAQLDDPADPQYQRHVHLFKYDASRGRILARDGTPLALDETVQIVGVVPGQIKNEQQMLQVLATDLGYSSDYIKQQYQGHSPDAFVAIRTLTQDQYNKISADLAPLLNAGVQVQSGTGRVYPYGADTAPVTGYVSVVQPQDLVNDTDHYYENNASQMVGHAGIEEWAETQLRPVKGGELDIVPLNADGSFGPPAYTLARRSPANGADVHTAIDLTLQQRAMADLRALKYNSGTVALDPATGEVLALASNPMSDPNDLSLGYTGSTLQFLNRAVQDAVPIGSVMKVTTLAAALESGIANTQTFTCTGSYLVPGESKPRIDDKATGHGTISVATGLAESCDVVFWQIGVQLNTKDPNILPQMAKSFGYGAKTGVVGLPADEENPGLVPDPQWLKASKNAGWSPTDAANLAIGQGFFLATPLQIAVVSAAVANNGQRMQPRLVTSVVSVDGQTIASYPAKALGALPVSADHLAILQGDMLGPTTQPDGTAYNELGHFPVLVAGKTGTAESGQPNPHALFVAYAPASPLGGPAVTPKIAMGVLVEYSSFGEYFAVPIARDLVGFYLHV